MNSMRTFIGKHPQITAWIALAVGMVIILIFSARDVGFTTGQWAAVIITTILLAGACVWIIGWDTDEDEEQIEEAEKEKDDEKDKTDQSASLPS